MRLGLRYLLLIALLLISATAFLYLASRPNYALYATLTDLERLSSHQLIASTSHSRYVLFKQLRGAGFNNQVQEILLFHHLALLTSRTYVYHPIVWRPRGEHSYIPLSAFLWGTTTNTITSAVFNEACPADKVKHVRLQTNHLGQWDLAKEVLNGDEPCLVVDDWILTWSFLASSSLQHIWPGYQDYLSSHFEWSQPIVDIVERTQRKLNISSKNFNRQGDRYMALHLRRGDFEDHCKYLAEKHVGFTTWATLPTLRSSITPPSLDTANLTSITEHCYPSLRRILHAVSQQAIKHPNLRTLHVLHDGAWDHPLVFLDYYKLVEALTNAAWAGRQRWADGQPMRRVTHSGMVQIHRGESDWRVAVDVELARRAEVFVGIGYSSLSTQVLALRLGADRGSTDDITLI